MLLEDELEMSMVQQMFDTEVEQGLMSTNIWDTPLGEVEISCIDDPVTTRLSRMHVTGLEDAPAIHSVVQGVESAVSLYMSDTQNPDAEEELIEELDGISSQQAVWFKGVRVGSISTAMVRQLKEHRLRRTSRNRG